jgi:hypothetical protein
MAIPVHKTDSDVCPYCHTAKVCLSLLSGLVLVRHMSMHILHDVHLKDIKAHVNFV